MIFHALFFQPFVAGLTLFGVDPVSGIEEQMQFFGGGHAVIGGIHRGRRTNDIVVAPGEPAGYFEAFGKIDDIVIRERFDFPGFWGFFPEIMGPPSGAVIQVSGKIAQSRVIEGQKTNPRIEGCRDDRQRSALAATGYP